MARQWIAVVFLPCALMTSSMMSSEDAFSRCYGCCDEQAFDDLQALSIVGKVACLREGREEPVKVHVAAFVREDNVYGHGSQFSLYQRKIDGADNFEARFCFTADQWDAGTLFEFNGVERPVCGAGSGHMREKNYTRVTHTCHGGAESRTKMIKPVMGKDNVTFVIFQLSQRIITDPMQ